MKKVVIHLFGIDWNVCTLTKLIAADTCMPCSRCFISTHYRKHQTIERIEGIDDMHGPIAKSMEREFAKKNPNIPLCAKCFKGVREF